MAADEKKESEESVDSPKEEDIEEAFHSSTVDNTNSPASNDELDSQPDFGKQAPKIKRVDSGSGKAFNFKIALDPFFIRENSPVTYFLIVVNVVLFVAMALATHGQSILMPSIEALHNWGANYGPFSLAQEPWRILTQCFLHIGFFHLLLNMIVLWDLGSLTERVYGSKYFFLLYFLAGLGGSCVSLICNPAITAAGASGAIFGVAGSLIIFCHVKRDMLDPLAYSKVREFAIILVLISALAGVFYNFDNGAHFGGFVTGILCGYLFAPGHNSPLAKLRPVSVVFVSAIVVGLYFVATLTPFDQDGIYKIQHGSYLLRERKTDRAMEIANQYIEQNPQKSFGYKLKGDVFKRLNINDKAIEFYSKSIGIDPKYGGAYVSRANSYLLNGELEKAIADADQAESLGESSSEIDYTKMMALAELGKCKEALVYCRKLLKKEDGRRDLYLLDRAKIYQIMGKPSEGLLDLDTVIEKNHSNVRAIECRAYAYYNLDRKTEAEQEVVKAEAVKKVADSYGYTSRAYASLTFSRYKQAIKDAKKIVTDFKDEKENIIYGAIVGRLASQMIDDQESLNFIDKQVSGFGPNNYWPYPVYRYLTGKISEQELYAYVGDNNNKMTEAKSFLAFDYEINKQNDRAISNYNWVIENGNPFYLEAELAKIRLSNLDSTPVNENSGAN